MPRLFLSFLNRKTLWSPPYLLVSVNLHVVLVLLVFGSGEAGGQRGGAGSVQDGGADELLPLPAALPLGHAWIQALLQGVLERRETQVKKCGTKVASNNFPLITSTIIQASGCF